MICSAMRQKQGLGWGRDRGGEGEARGSGAASGVILLVSMLSKHPMNHVLAELLLLLLLFFQLAKHTVNVSWKKQVFHRTASICNMN